MPAEKDRSERKDEQRGEPSPFERFTDLTKRLLHVSKDDLDQARESEKEERRPA